jgi:hypothetical protein
VHYEHQEFLWCFGMVCHEVRIDLHPGLQCNLNSRAGHFSGLDNLEESQKSGQAVLAGWKCIENALG